MSLINSDFCQFFCVKLAQFLIFKIELYDQKLVSILLGIVLLISLLLVLDQLYHSPLLYMEKLNAFLEAITYLFLIKMDGLIFLIIRLLLNEIYYL